MPCNHKFHILKTSLYRLFPMEEQETEREREEEQEEKDEEGRRKGPDGAGPDGTERGQAGRGGSMHLATASCHKTLHRMPGS